MKHVFISHAGRDTPIAEKLYNDLKDVGHDVRIDRKELKFGDDTIDFMNNAIADAHTVLIVFSEHTDAAVWQRKEINAAVWNETAQDGGKVIVLKVGNATKLPPLIGPKLFGALDPDQYKDTLQKLCTAIKSLASATALVYAALSEGSENPFWRVRAEYFEEMPKLLAEAFSPPVSAKFRLLEQMLPCFLEGSRGTGKTMLLLSLRARILAARSDSAVKPPQLFGVYVRLERGAFCNAGIHTADGRLKDDIAREDLVQLTDLFSQEFYICLVESLISELAFCVKQGHITLPSSNHSLLVTALATLIKGADSPRPWHCEELLGTLAGMHREIADFVRRKFIYREVVRVPFTHFDIDLFKNVVAEVRKHVPTLQSTQVTILLDEYENLFAYQKVVVNSLIKLGPPALSVKVARKAGTEETSATTLGQELQETHDYTRIPLIYSVEDDVDFSRYLQLLESMVKRTLASHNLSDLDLAGILPADSSDEISHDALRQAAFPLLKVSEEEFDKWDEARQTTKLTYYREAAIYRHLYGTPGRRTRKRFSGHKDLAFVSSGVIRYFQEIIGMAFHLQVSSGDGAAMPILPKHQSEAVHTVSDHNLSMLSRNIESHGETLKYFLLDLGDCLRQKLLCHTSEPEAARIAIKDPELLLNQAFADLNTIVHIGVKEGVFQTIEGRPGIRPKHVDDPQPVEVNIARVFAPTLQISPRLRWATLFTCSELSGLLSGDERRKTKSKLIGRLSGKKIKKTDERATLFGGTDE
ncbi:MAG: toll/interleukin-1 receptor domain-containing protein [Planctomyces sp.]|jgi:hypothetical protein